MFWEPPGQTTTLYDHVQEIKAEQLPDLEAKDAALPFLESLSLFLLLVSPDVPNTQLEGLISMVKRLWEKLTQNDELSLPTLSSFMKLVYMGIFGGSHAPFYTLCILASQESFKHYQTYVDSFRQEDSSTRCT